MVKPPAVVCRGGSRDLADKIAAAVNGETVVANGDKTLAALQIAFREERPLIAIFPAAIIIRALAPLIGSKYHDPPVVSVTLNGRFIVPLLGLNHGAERLAGAIEREVGGTRVKSSGTAIKFHTAVDEAPDGYVLHNTDDYKDFAVRLLDGEPVRIEGEAPWLSALPQSPDARLVITVTEKDIPGSAEQLVFHASTLAVGVGCERGTEPREVEELIEETLRANGLSKNAIGCFASIDLKEDEPAINTIQNGMRVCFFTADELNRQSARIKNPSETVRHETGTPSVAEAAALAAAGRDSELIVPKTKSRRATCAIARARQPIQDLPGRPNGALYIVGIGPGQIDMRSSAARLWLWGATDWVGYSLYLDLAADIQHGQTLHPFPLGAEDDRARHAIALAKEGKQVALICSGDPTIYAMASLVYEILEREPARIAVEVIPGVSAFQAASAKAGAMIGHDFCCISLSDLLTPWEAIEKRLRAAAEGDFVVALYNPRSEKRRDHLDRAVAILRQHRPETTPVVVASNLGRKDEKFAIVPLRAFDSSAVDMLTIVLVGSSQSKSFKRGDGKTYAYTPRGYAAKREASA